MPRDHFAPMAAQQNSFCHDVKVKFVDPIEWKGPNELCSKDQEIDSDFYDPLMKGMHREHGL